MTTAASYPVSTIAKLFDLSERRVQQLAKEGIIPQSAKGRYELVASVQGYVKYLRTSKEETSTNISAERARLLKMQADNLEQEMKLRNRKLLDSDEVKKEWITMLNCCRSVMLGIPNRLAYQLAAITEPQELAKILKQAIYEALTELSEDNNQNYKENSNEDINTNKKDSNKIDELHTYPHGIT